jgi:hypothetical protein
VALTADALPVLTAIVDAHDVRHPRTGARDAIDIFRSAGGPRIQHRAIEEGSPLFDADDALFEELRDHGLINIDYGSGIWHITPTTAGRETVEQHQRVMAREPVADIGPLLGAIEAQSEAEHKLAWEAVRPVLAALRRYWEDGGLSRHGVQLVAVLEGVPDEHLDLFAATLQALVAGEYLVPTGGLSANGVPAEVAFSNRALQALDGWPGASPDELVENLLAVLAASAGSEPDPAKKRKLERVAETIKELGISTASDVIARVLLGR